MGQGRRDEAEERKRFVADLKEKSNRLQAESHNVQEELQAKHRLWIPTLRLTSCPKGALPRQPRRKLVESYTNYRKLRCPHWELARKYDIIDFDRRRLTGAGSLSTKARELVCARALINYFSTATPGRLPRRNRRSGGQRSLASARAVPPWTRKGRCTTPRPDNFYMIPTVAPPDEHLPAT